MDIFEQSLKQAGVPTSDEELRQEFQSIADNSGLEIANNSPYSAFWVFVQNAVTKPIQYLIRFLITTVLPNVYVQTATGAYLDLLSWTYGIKRKEAVKMTGLITFYRTDSEQTLNIPAGTIVESRLIKGIRYNMVSINEAEFDVGELTIDVLCEAEFAGGNYNLGAGYYNSLKTPVVGVTKVSNLESYLVTAGADIESDMSLKLRIRDRFAAVGQWHTNAKYRSMITEISPISPDQIYIKKYHEVEYPEPGPGGADIFIVFDSESSPEATIDLLNRYINEEGYHGHGDNIRIKSMPVVKQDLTVEINFWPTAGIEQKVGLLNDIKNAVSCAFWGNNDYIDDVSRVMPYNEFSFSKLDHDLHILFPEIKSINYEPNRLKSEMYVTHLDNLTVKEGQ